MGIEKKTISTKLGQEDIDALTTICEAENRSMSNLIETIIKQFLRSKNSTLNEK
ncbi:MAG: hypothetical protein FWC62_08820 [Firmicutes bacterium]|nr:hypothetical protein [Bacillota bacterium]